MKLKVCTFRRLYRYTYFVCERGRAFSLRLDDPKSLYKKLKFYLIAFLSTDVPIVDLKMGSNLNPDEIKEGDDVYFECTVKANPKTHRLVWFHNVSCYLSKL